ncbi:hypothetical protein HXX01_03220, partial [Candidatus Nomurabacteria bacterium]|nr:hypothetical protein [Candidatus Nomurabacteria bacterium]
DEISRWSGMLQVGDGEAKYKADCSNCGKVTMVPFEPQEGRPVYCKECMFKIKSGELKPQTGFIASRSSRQEEKVSTAPLAALGIEFGVTDTNFRVSKNKEQTKNSAPINMDTNHHNGHIKSNSGIANKNHYNNEHNNNHFVKPERKHTGPSPLLKGLLEKIGINGTKEGVISTDKMEAVEVKKEVPKAVSLSSLKNDTPKVVKNEYVAPVKEASEEKKSSLKDLLAKTAHNHNHEIKKVESEIKEEIKPVVKEPEIEIKKEEPIVIKVEEKKIEPEVEKIEPIIIKE